MRCKFGSPAASLEEVGLRGKCRHYRWCSEDGEEFCVCPDLDRSRAFDSEECGGCDFFGED